MKNKTLSKYLSYLLRHNPEDLNLKMDEFGWVKIEEIITKISEQKTLLTRSMLEEIVSTSEKQRFKIDFKNDRIRANQGHSINVNLQLEEKNPPDKLFHGTSTKYKESILSEGIKKMNRHLVHLSEDYNIAKQVGSRHGRAVVLEINSKEMNENGFKFYLSENNVWLTEYVSPEFIKYTE